MLYYTFSHTVSFIGTIQYAYRAKNGHTWKRNKNSSGVWSNWQRVYDEGILADSTVLSPLASALGASFFGSGGTVDDANDAALNRVSYVTSNGANKPSGSGSGWLITFAQETSGNQGYRLQFFFDHNNSKLWWRGSKASGSSLTWTSWSEI